MTNTGWLQVAQEALKVPGLIVEIYGDLARPGVRQVGKALDTVLGLGNTILWPITWANERSRIYLERNLERYRERLEQIPEEKVISVAPEIGVPIAEKLAYVRDERLSDLYVSLLSKASCSDTVSDAHPSFVNVINNLSPDEAQLLEYFTVSQDLLYVSAKWVDPKDGNYSFAGDLLVAPEHLAALTFAQNVPAYLSNLSGLGLVSVHPGRTLTKSEAKYELIETHWKSALPQVHPTEPERKLEFEQGVVTSTEFGKQFIAACHKR
jgi:hypothetical protein